MRGRVAAATMALAFALAGCTASAPSPAPGASGPGVATTAGSTTPTGSDATSESPSATPSVEAPRLAVGDCTGAIDFAVGSISDLPAISCTGEHHWEVIAVTEVPSETFPGAAALAKTAKASCGQAFTSYVGVAQPYSRFASAYLAGGAAAWADPTHRTITCLAGSAEGGLLGSAKDDTRIFPDKGQCTGPQDVSAAAIEVIDCASRHHYEVFATKEVTTKKAPTEAEEQKLFTSVCLAGFTKFVGVDSTKSKYEVSYFLAGSDIWKKVGDHRIVCSAGSPEGGIKGSLKGKKK